MIVGMYLAAANPLEHVLPHPLHLHIGPFELTNQMFMALVAAVLMLLIFPWVFRRSEGDAPTGAKNFLEVILEFLRVEVFRPALKQHTDRFVPFLWTVFFFILFCNLLGQIPIGEIITLMTGRPSHWGGTATGTLTTTGALAICAFLYIHANGVWQVARDLMHGTYGHHDHGSHDPVTPLRGEALPADGDAHHHAHVHAPEAHGMNPAMALPLAVPLYLWNFAPHPFKPKAGDSPLGWVADIPLWGLLLFLELVGSLIKPFALMMRLFANMIAGHIVLAALVLLIPVASGFLAQAAIGIPVTALSLLIRMLELFVAFLQAYIFTFLTTLFIASAVAPEH